VREGVWIPPGICLSSIEEFTAVRRLDKANVIHVRRGSRGWDNVGVPKAGSREERLLELVRTSPPPHEQVVMALGQTQGDGQIRTGQVLGRACWIFTYAFDPGAIRGEVTSFFQRAAEPPDTIHWGSLEGTLEIALAKHDPQDLLRVAARSRVDASVNVTGRIGRKTHAFETVYEFYDHGKADVNVPVEIMQRLFNDMPERRDR
jgi:hypothetical protein